MTCAESFRAELNNALSYLNELPAKQERIRQFLISEGLSDLYAECMASEITESWANDDPAPLHMSPGYVPSQNDAKTLEECDLLRRAVTAWKGRA